MKTLANTKQSGFTLIELLVVVAIIGLLSSVVFAALSSARQRARVAESILELRNVNTAIMSYYAANGSYPVVSGWSGFNSCWGAASVQYIPGIVPTYMPSLPREPLNNTSCNSQYIYSSDGNNYKLIYHDPENCSVVKASYPNLVDPIRDCTTYYAYGFWSPGGVSF